MAMSTYDTIGIFEYRIETNIIYFQLKGIKIEL